jgi:hypothetical protein
MLSDVGAVAVEDEHRPHRQRATKRRGKLRYGATRRVDTRARRQGAGTAFRAWSCPRNFCARGGGRLCACAAGGCARVRRAALRTSPSSTMPMLAPKRIFCSERRERVTKGRVKSRWSMCGGMQSPSE